MTDECLECFNPIDLRLNFFSRISKPPGSVEELKKAKTLILAHCTSSIFLSDIKKYGLSPDTNGKRGVNDGLPSDAETVYLLCRLDKFYLERAVKEHGGEGVVIVVEVDRMKLKPDENGTALAAKENPPSDDDVLYHSLFCFGQCKHQGSILPQRIRGIYKADGTKLWSGDDE